MKSILFPTDFSAPAQNAYTYALNLACALEATVTTLHVYNKPDVRELELPPTLQREYDRIDIETFENFRTEVPSLRDIARQVNCDHIEVRHAMKAMVANSNVHQTIVDFADEEKVDLIVIGSHENDEVVDTIFGSTTAEVIENANCPVLAVPETADNDGRLDKMAMAYNFEPQAPAFVNQLLEYTAPFNGTLEIVHVDHNHTEEIAHRMDGIKKMFAANERVQFRVLDGDDLTEAFAGYVHENQIDILTMFNRKRTFLQELFHYNKAKEILKEIDTPVLSLPLR